MHADQLPPELDKNAPGVACVGLLSFGGKPGHGMSFGTFMATEGGRKCPQCGKYAKREELGNLSFKTHFPQGWAHISMYGHLPGYGCNISDNTESIHPESKP
jgi:hypothetical protein